MQCLKYFVIVVNILAFTWFTSNPSNIHSFYHKEIDIAPFIGITSAQLVNLAGLASLPPSTLQAYLYLVT